MPRPKWWDTVILAPPSKRRLKYLTILGFIPVVGTIPAIYLMLRDMRILDERIAKMERR